jgi:hypothetical protein
MSRQFVRQRDRTTVISVCNPIVRGVLADCRFSMQNAAKVKILQDNRKIRPTAAIKRTVAPRFDYWFLTGRSKKMKHPFDIFSN